MVTIRYLEQTTSHAFCLLHFPRGLPSNASPPLRPGLGPALLCGELAGGFTKGKHVETVTVTKAKGPRKKGVPPRGPWGCIFSGREGYRAFRVTGRTLEGSQPSAPPGAGRSTGHQLGDSRSLPPGDRGREVQSEPRDT